jgi:serralysin
MKKKISIWLAVVAVYGIGLVVACRNQGTHIGAGASPMVAQEPATPTASQPGALDIPCVTLTQGTKAWGFSQYFWKNKHEFAVKFLDGDASSEAKVKSAVQAWTQAANIKFVWVQSGNADIRISFRGVGHWSRVGTDALNVPQTSPTMNLQLTANDGQDEFNRVARHEFGHALGLMHEHQHPGFAIQWNKPAVYKWYSSPPNMWSHDVVDKQVFAVYSGPFTGTEPDSKSIMMYPILPGWTLNGFTVGWNRDLSPLDKAFIKQKYP